VLERKEIENYLLIPAALDRAVRRTLAAGGGKTGAPMDGVDSGQLLEEIVGPMRDDVLVQAIARREEFFRKKGVDASVTHRETLKWFEQRWSSPSGRLSLVSGKDVLGAFRQQIHHRYGVTLTDARVVDAINKEDVPADMVSLLERLEAFRQA
jgi:hypothetical protein